MNARMKMTVAIRQSCRDWVWFATPLIRLRPKEKPGIGTIGADTRFNLYYDPEYVDGLSMDDLIYKIKESVAAPFLRHHERGRQLIYDAHSQAAFTKASKISLNTMFQADGQHIPDGEPTVDNTTLKDGTRLAKDMCLEEYFSYFLAEEEDEGDDHGPQNPDGDGEGEGEGGGSGSGEGDGEGEGDGDQPHSDPPPGGSSQDGQPRPWEDEPQHTGMDEPSDGVTDGELNSIRQDMLDNCSNNMSKFGGGDFSRTVKDMQKPQLKPHQLLRMAIASNINRFRRGTKEQTYRRPSRRTRPCDPFIRPSYIDPTPSIAVVVDTSGSMSRSDIKLAMGVIDMAIKNMNVDDIRVVSGDTEIRNDQRKIKRLSEVDLQGGGGTNMARIIDTVLSEPDNKLPDLVLLVTDGGTGWPVEKHKVPFVACITGEYRLWGTPPDWMPKVCISNADYNF